MVAVSIAPLANIASRIAGDRLEVKCVLPPGRSEHAYDPTPREVAALSSSRMSVSVGLEMDTWLSRIVRNAAGDDVREVELGPQLDPRRMTLREVGSFEEEEGEHEEHEEHEEHAHEEHEEHEEHAHEEHEEHAHEEHAHEEHAHEEHAHEEHEEHAHEGHAHHHGAFDPHFWLDPVRMQDAVDVLVREFTALDPDGAAGFTERGDALKAELSALHAEITRASEGWQKHTIVTFHGSFGYFAARYGLEIAAVVEPFPGREPTPRYMSDVLGALRGHDVAALFSEPQLDPRPATVIAQESGVPLFELDPVGGTEGRETYEALMRQNTAVLTEALGGAR